MRLEQISERIRDHLTNQKAQSILADNFTCLYRGPEGRMCAVGCLIDDAHYDTAFEGQSAAEPRVIVAVLNSLVVDPSVTVVALGHMLDDWQNYHDNGDYYRWCADAAAAISPAEYHASVADEYWPE